MSRREDRNSDSKRHRSRFDREPSPKRSRRDGKPETERSHNNTEFDKDRLDRDQKQRRRLQDAVAHDLKVETGTTSKESENKSGGRHGGTVDSSEPTKVPRSQSYFQHDDRGSVGQNGRSSGRRTDKVSCELSIACLSLYNLRNKFVIIHLLYQQLIFLESFYCQERGWWRDPNEQKNDHAENTKVESLTKQTDEKAKDNREDNRAWRHDGYFEMEANPKPLARKRPFREQKLPANSEDTGKAASADPMVPNPRDRAVESGRRDERGHTSRYSGNRYERSFSGQRESNRAEAWRGNSSSSFRDRNNASGNYRDRFTAAGQDSRPTGGRVDKWKHDLYDEANKSPTPKKEEDQISKIEALLAS
ncbi:hypothetical protein ACJIZ3_001251 [Penstemon smallii]|uniref:Btz domain-containing protein n=1 Tax=Penstemon smallii TaxID=265156 RepID=A0ABD3U5H2_9LAMI